MVDCPICNKLVKQSQINAHLDSGCTRFLDLDDDPPSTHPATRTPKNSGFTSFFQKASTQPSAGQAHDFKHGNETASLTPTRNQDAPTETIQPLTPTTVEKPENAGIPSEKDTKRSFEEYQNGFVSPDLPQPPPKRVKQTTATEKAAPLAERMRPKTLDDVCGQALVGRHGILRGLIERSRVPSMILWGAPGTGKTTIARLISKTANTRFVEINSTSSGVGECKKLFAEAKNELNLTGRKSIIFCDEIHRFSKSQQDVFLAPVEAGLITLIGSTTENPSFKVIAALLSRCRTFTLAQLGEKDLQVILQRALAIIQGEAKTDDEESQSNGASAKSDLPPASYPLINDTLIEYLAISSAGDARTALNLLELAVSLTSTNPELSLADLKLTLTRTLIYDRSGDAHYDHISAFHKSIRGSDADAALFYLSRMIAAGEDPLYIARRLIVIASEDIGLADDSMLPLAIAAHSAVEKVGMPEARINLGHLTVRAALAKKSTRAYRGLNQAMSCVKGEGEKDDGKGASAQVPLHLRNAPTRLMRDMRYGAEYKYPPDYREGKVKQEYLPKGLIGRKFLPDEDFGDTMDPDLDEQGHPRESQHEADMQTEIQPEQFNQSYHLDGMSERRGDEVKFEEGDEEFSGITEEEELRLQAEMG